MCWLLAGSQSQTDTGTHKWMSTHAESSRCISTSRSRTQAGADQCGVREDHQVQEIVLLTETTLVRIKYARMDCSLWKSAHAEVAGAKELELSSADATRTQSEDLSFYCETGKQTRRHE